MENLVKNTALLNKHGQARQALCLSISTEVMRDILRILNSIYLESQLDIDMSCRPSGSSKGGKHSHDVYFEHTLYRIILSFYHRPGCPCSYY